jgi:hypothetical protein
MSIQNATIVNSTAGAIYTSSGNNVISTIHICNPTTSSAFANIYVVPSGGTANAVTQIYSNVFISSYNTLITQEKFALGNGDAIYANANIAGMGSTISYVGF